MPTLVYHIKTPLGEFSSAAQAARAHKCDRSTILNRCETNPEEYQKTQVNKPPKPKKYRPKVRATTATWPISWYQYRSLPEDQREEIFLAWCARNQHTDTESEDIVNAFFDELDLVKEPEDDTAEDPEHTAV